MGYFFRNYVPRSGSHTGDKSEDNGKNREEAIVWLEKMIIILRKNIIEEINKDTAFEQNKIKILQKMQDTYTIIKTTNVNQRFALENLFLSI